MEFLRRVLENYVTEVIVDTHTTVQIKKPNASINEVCKIISIAESIVYAPYIDEYLLVDEEVRVIADSIYSPACDEDLMAVK
jgi:ribosomal protein S12